MPQNLRELPKFRDSWSYLYVEHCQIDKDAQSIAMHDVRGKVPIPCASLALLLIGPGTTITHSAIRVLAESGCSVVWCGEQGVRFYAQGLGQNRSSDRLVRQAILCSNPELRLQVVLRMYRMRFNEQLPDHLTLQQIRGMEGARVRDAYARLSRETGIPWSGRSYNRKNWNDSDMVNQALSVANACLYGICHSAIVALGYSPGLGFIHTGKQLSFVYDVADLYKVDITIPTAFQAAVKYRSGSLERLVRQTMRDLIVEYRLLPRIVEDIEYALGIDKQGTEDEYREILAEDAARPGYLWGLEEITPGGVNYASASEEGDEQ